MSLILVFVTGMVLLSRAVINILRNSHPDRLESIGIYNVINWLKLIHRLASYDNIYIHIPESLCNLFFAAYIFTIRCIWFVLASNRFG